MWMDSDRDDDGGDGYHAPHGPGAVRDPSAYWRRRFLILGGGIAIVAACVLLFPGAQHPAARISAAASASMAALDQRGELPAAAYGSSWDGAHQLQATPHPTATALIAAANYHQTGTAFHAAASPIPSPIPSPSPTPSASASPAREPRCTPSNIVLSLFTGQSGYGQGAAPKFDVYAVSTSPAACTLSYGAGSVQVVVTRHGRVVWDSAACKPPAAAAARFTLGVPQMLSITWNRRATGPSGCAGTLPAGAVGTFDVVALTDGQSSTVRSFTLSR